MSETAVQQTIPATIAAGIVRVIGSVKRLAKLDENKFQKYNYTSIDTFLEAMGPLLAEAGLFILSEESSTEIIKTEKASREGDSSWLKMQWAFTVGHQEGASIGPFHRSVMVPASGAQAFGSGQSYALKQFMRGIFLIPTGDADDPDSQPKHTLPGGPQAEEPELTPEEKCDLAVDECEDATKLIEIHKRAKARFTGEALMAREKKIAARMEQLILKLGEHLATAEIAEGWKKFVVSWPLFSEGQRENVYAVVNARLEELQQAAPA